MTSTDVNLRDQFFKIVTYVFPEDCFEELLMKFNIFNKKCVRLVLSRILGLGIVAGSILVKVPQIVKIQRAGSGAGVSLLGNFLELFCLTAMVAYSFVSRFNFSAWGDSLMIAIQTSIIIMLIMWYKGRKIAASIFLPFYAAISIFLSSGYVPLGYLAMIQSINIPVVVAAKAVQAFENFRNQSTGQLSPVTVFMQFAGCSARIFTSIQETGDRLMIWTFIFATIMNGVIFAQILLYWGRKMPKKLE